MNWEGHDEWFHDTSRFSEFLEGVPPAIVKPRPKCAELAEKHKANSYEQVPLPGENCIEEKQPRPGS